MGRPPGAKNKPGGIKPGPKVGRTRLRARWTVQGVKDIKQRVLDMMDAREVDNLSQAARRLGVSPSSLYQWKQADPEWGRQTEQVWNIIADELEEQLDAYEGRWMPYVTARIVRLKALRP